MALPPADTTEYRTRVIRSDFDAELTADITRNPTLCRNCACLTGLVRRHGPRGVCSYAQSWFTIPETEHGALHGCPFCQLRLRSFTGDEFVAARTCDRVDFDFRFTGAREGARIMFNMHAGNELMVTQKLRLYLADGAVYTSCHGPFR